MTSMQPYTPRFDNTHMWNIRDLRGCYPIVKYRKDSIMCRIHSNPDLSKFEYLIKLAKLEGLMDDPQANITVFVPSNKAIEPLGDNWAVNADIGWAFNLVRTSTVNRRITSELLGNSPAFYLYTRDDPNRLFITNINNQTKINNNVCILQPDIQCTNGLIHIVDKLILPTWSGMQEQ